MEDKMKTLLDSINAAVEAKTFSIEVLQNIAELRQKVIDQDNKIVTLNAQIKEVCAKNTELTNQNAAMKTNEENVKRREAAVADAEKQQALNTLKTQMTEQFKGELMTVMLTAFKNPTIKQTMFGTELGNSNGYSTTIPVSKTTTTETE